VDLTPTLEKRSPLFLIENGKGIELGITYCPVILFILKIA
jgi:hypothetical protein